MSLGPPLERHARVVVRLPNWLGDFVMSEPLVRALDGHLTRGALTLLGPPRFFELCEGRFPRAVRRAPESAASWRGHDVALLCTGSFRSAWSAWRARIPRRLGFARDGRGWLLTDALEPAREGGATPLGLGTRGATPRFLPRPLERSLAELLGGLGVLARDSRPRLEVQGNWLATARARRARLALDVRRPYVLANVGARAGSAKGVPPELWRAVLGELARHLDLPILLVAGPEEGVPAALAGLPSARIVAEPPADLPELAALCAEAALVLTNDAGPRHVARAVGAPVVAVAGPTDPRHTAGERGPETLVRNVVPCGPCHRELCPLVGPEQHVCMTALEPERIVRAALELLGERRDVPKEPTQSDRIPRPR
jgi:heptosyltransferase-2